MLIISFIIGLIFSWVSCSLILLLTYMVYVELIVFMFVYPTGKWETFNRIGYVFASLLGWIIGRVIHKLPTHFISKEEDKRYGLRLVCS